MKIYEGNLIGTKLKFGIVASRFNDFIVHRLVEGAHDALLRHGVDDNNIDLYWVPGAFELPLAAKKMVDTTKYDAVIVLGAVIRGSTPHFDYVCSEVSKGVTHAMLDSGYPVSFGVLTCDNMDQAIERAGSKSGNKGYEAAITAIETANLFRKI